MTPVPTRVAAGLLPLMSLLLLAGACAKSVDSCLQEMSREGTHQCMLEHDGSRRTFRVYLPANFDPSRPTPVVFAFHGGLGTGKYMQRSTGFDEVADENGFVVVYPDGIRRTWNAGGCCETAMRENVDDVGFVNAMIDSLSEKLPIDPRRIYATGFSNGSMLSHRLACELSDQIASIAAVSGVIMIPPCTPESAVSVLVMHGTDDPRSLWEGGVGDKNPEKGVRESIPVTMQRLQDRYDCATTDRTFLQKNAVTCTERQCTGGVAVGLCRIEGGGHQWPGSKAVWPDRLGPVNTDISASRVIWEFFAAHPKPAVAEQAAPATRQTMQP